MVAQTTPTREDERPLAVAGQVVEMQVVEPPQWVQPAQRRRRALLPVHPPEIDADVLQIVMEHLEVGVGETRVGNIEGNRVASAQVDFQSPAHFRVGGLVRPNTQRRMQVQRRPQPLRMEPGDEVGWVGEERLVPGVARPTTDALADIDQVPIHVNDTDRQRDIVGAEVGHQRPQVGISIGPVAAPPIAQRPARQQRRVA